MHQTYAQVSFPPPADVSNGLSAKVEFKTCWRDYDEQSGVAGDIIAGSCRVSRASPSTYFDTLSINDIKYVDNGNGSVTATLGGTFPQSTRIAVGDSYMDQSVAGFEVAPTTLRFTAPSQLLAVRGARLISPDGSVNEIVLDRVKDQPSHVWWEEIDPSSPAGALNPVIIKADEPNPSPARKKEIEGSASKALITYLPSQFAPGTILKVNSLKQSISVDRLSDAEGIHLRLPTTVSPRDLAFERSDHSTCTLPFERGPAQWPEARVGPYSDSLVEVSLSLSQCVEAGPSNPPLNDWVVVLAGHAFGLSDSPFLSFRSTGLSFLAPKSLLQGQSKLTLKRMFLNEQYATTYTLVAAPVSVTGISVVRSVKSKTTFAITGSNLMQATFVGYPAPAMPKCCSTYALVTLTSDEIASIKQLVLQPADHSTPYFITLPAAKPSDDSSALGASDYSISLLQSSTDDTSQGATYVISSSQGVASLAGASVVFPQGVKPTLLDDFDLQFSLNAKVAAATKQVVLKIRPDDAATVLLTLPALQKADTAQDASAKKLTFDKKIATISRGSSGPYTIKGTNFQLIEMFRYLGTPLAVHYSDDFTTATFDSLPPGLTASTGKVSLEVRLVDGTTQTYSIPVAAP
jgi:hypothetical protein